MATLIASQAKSGVIPHAIHSGVNAIVSVYSLTATLSAGDIIQWCKLPSGAKVISGRIGWNVALSATTAADSQVNVGTRSDQDQFLVSATIMSARTVAFDAVAGFAYEFSLSDSSNTRYTMIESLIGGTMTTGTKSGTISMMIQYVMDQSDI